MTKWNWFFFDDSTQTFPPIETSKELGIDSELLEKRFHYFLKENNKYYNWSNFSVNFKYMTINRKPENKKIKVLRRPVFR